MWRTHNQIELVISHDHTALCIQSLLTWPNQFRAFTTTPPPLRGQRVAKHCTGTGLWFNHDLIVHIQQFMTIFTSSDFQGYWINKCGYNGRNRGTSTRYCHKLSPAPLRQPLRCFLQATDWEPCSSPEADQPSTQRKGVSHSWHQRSSYSTLESLSLTFTVGRVTRVPTLLK